MNDALYEWAKNGLFHLTSKPVNTNAQACGVRLSLDWSLDLPYVSVRTELDRGIPRDYASLSPNSACARVKSIMTSLDEIKDDSETDLDEEDSEPVMSKEDRDSLLQGYISPISYGKMGTATVSPRLRQMLLPTSDGYVSITPLSSAGLATVINTAVGEINQRNKETGSYIKTATFKHGGKKTQNFAYNGLAMQKPVVAFSPTATKELKTAYSVYHKGVRLALPFKLIKEYSDWLHQGKDTLWSMAKDVIEQNHINLITHEVLLRAQRSARTFHDEIEDVPADISSAMDQISQGLLGFIDRDLFWKKDFSNDLAMKLSTFSLGKKNRISITLGLGDADILRISKKIQTAVQGFEFDEKRENVR